MPFVMLFSVEVNEELVHPEKEPTRLLLPQSPDDTSSMTRRRPADVYVPAMGGGPVAFDVAAQRQETFYAAHKEQHLNTGAECRRQGVSFTPMVVETTGAWDAVAAKVLKHLAYATAARSGATPGELHQSLLEELSVVVRSWRAKAALQRRFEVTTPESA